eukprot:901835-Amphidinium_carterae.1
MLGRSEKFVAKWWQKEEKEVSSRVFASHVQERWDSHHASPWGSMLLELGTFMNSELWNSRVVACSSSCVGLSPTVSLSALSGASPVGSA